MNRFLFLVIMCFFIPTVAQAGWEGPNKKHSFPKSFPAGKEADGRKLYISQCVLRDTTFQTFYPYYHTENKGWHIGKAGVHLKDGMTFPYGGKNMTVIIAVIMSIGSMWLMKEPNTHGYLPVVVTFLKML